MEDTRSLLTKLHPYYIEICRRMRLVQHDKQIVAVAAGTKLPRVALKEISRGVTGDPWTPVELDDKGVKALTVDRTGFACHRLAKIFSSREIQPAPLQALAKDEGGDGWSLLCRAIARGQGKTKGYHERRVAIPPKVLRRIRRGELPEIGILSRLRIDQAAAVRQSASPCLDDAVPVRGGTDRSSPRITRRHRAPNATLSSSIRTLIVTSSSVSSTRPASPTKTGRSNFAANGCTICWPARRISCAAPKLGRRPRPSVAIAPSFAPRAHSNEASTARRN